MQGGGATTNRRESTDLLELKIVLGNGIGCTARTCRMLLPFVTLPVLTKELHSSLYDRPREGAITRGLEETSH